jgi:hypothetical protein
MSNADDAMDAAAVDVPDATNKQDLSASEANLVVSDI